VGQLTICSFYLLTNSVCPQLRFHPLACTSNLKTVSSLAHLVTDTLNHSVSLLMTRKLADLLFHLLHH
jgi:hypothetical protein